MYPLYLDGSGTHSDARHFVLAGVCVYESNAHWAADQLDRIQSSYFPDYDDSVHFHATSLFAMEMTPSRFPLDQLDRRTRLELLLELYEIVFKLYGTFFAVVIEKSYLGEDPYEHALEQIHSRFDRFLGRMSGERGQRDKGLIVIADSQYRERLEVLSRQLAREGTQWGELRNIFDVPFFALSKNSRLLQIADLIANAVYGRYESGHASMFDKMLPKFDSDGSGRIHGLLHLTSSRLACYMPCCLMRRLGVSS